MKTYILEDDLKVFGVQVKNFPDGVAEAYHSLIEMIPGGGQRSYFGIFWTDELGNMVYCAAAEELQPGEAEQYKCKRYIIEKGEYISEAIHDWREKTACIKDVFAELSRQSSVDQKKPGIEWYKSTTEMWCMLKTLSRTGQKANSTK